MAMPSVEKVIRSRAIAIHEAAHAVAHCHLGYGIDLACVASKGFLVMTEMGGSPTAVLGFVRTSVIFTKLKGYSSIKRLGEARRILLHGAGLREISCLLAGPLAEARYRHRSVDSLVEGGIYDWGRALHIAFWIEPDNPRSAILFASAIVREFFRVPGVWAHITAVADVLSREGVIRGDHPLLCRATHQSEMPQLRFERG